MRIRRNETDYMMWKFKEAALCALLIVLVPVLEKRWSVFPQTALTHNAVRAHSKILEPAFQRFLQEYSNGLQAALQEEGVPGAAFAIVKDGAVAEMKTIGKRRPDAQEPVGRHTVFRLASLSKGMIGLLAARAVEDSLLDWNTPVADWLPEVRFREDGYGEELELQHLLSHTTGLPRHTYSNLLNMGRSYQDILELLPRVYPAYPIGTHHDYQNVTFNLAGDMLACAYGKALETVLEEQFFEPLGMKDASASYSAMLQEENRAMPCRRTRYGFRTDELEPDYYEVPAAAGVNASISDMAKWLKFVMGYRPEVASPSVLQKAFEGYIDIPRGASPFRHWSAAEHGAYAMGWRVFDTGNYRIVGHSGFVNGYRAEIAFCPSEKIGIVILTNAPNYTIGSSVPAFFEQYFQEYAYCSLP